MPSPGHTAWILGDQLSHDNPVFDGAERVLIIESRAKLESLPFHRQKLHLILSAMRHFAAELREQGLEVDYRSARSLASGLRSHIREHRPKTVRLLTPSALDATDTLGALDRVEIHEGSLQLTDLDWFREWLDGRKQPRMEHFYREQRRHFGVLLDSADDPAGGSWNFDQDNREPPPADRRPPKPYRPRESEIDDEVRADLDSMSLQTFGEDGPRLFPATRDEARRALDRFIVDRLPDFGRWQDAMLTGEPFMWHALLGSSLNLGLIGPMECIRAAEAAYEAGDAPIEATEGFIRQILGWREYVWATYRIRGRELRRANALKARTSLPDAFWSGETDMACLADTIESVRTTAYAHHIQRLMVLGNLTLGLGVKPGEVHDWFHATFIDAYEWVMVPNVYGMALHADGGKMMSKPYISTGRYIARMSDYCDGCRYDPAARTGDDACPLSILYWDFLDRNSERLSTNNRMGLQLRNLKGIPPGELEEIRSRARGLKQSFGA